MKGPYAMAAAGALTAVVLAGVVGLGARGGGFGIGGEDEEHWQAAPAVVTEGAPAADAGAPALERVRRHDDDDDDDRRERRHSRERDDDDEDDDD